MVAEWVRFGGGRPVVLEIRPDGEGQVEASAQLLQLPWFIPHLEPFQMRTLNPAYLEALYHNVNASPFPRHLPMRIVEVGLDRSRIELDIGEYHLQPFGIVHGGVIATLIDTATFWAAFGSIPEDAGLVNIDLKLNYLQSVTEGELVAVGKSIRAGRTISYAEAVVQGEDGALIAHGTSTLMVLPGKGLSLGLAKFTSSNT